MDFNYLIKGGVVVSGSAVTKADVGIQGEKIISIEADLPSKEAKQTIDASGKYVMPGVIDAHAHPVYLDDSGGLSYSAIFGGVTTLLHFAYAEEGMKLYETTKELKEDGLKKSYLDFGIHATLMHPRSQIEEIPKMFDLGVTTFKMFMAFPRQNRMADDYQLTAAMDLIAECGGLAMVHAENGLVIEYLEQQSLKRKENQRNVFLKNRPSWLEAESTFRAIAIAAITGCPLYVVHLSAARALGPIAQAKAEGQRVYAETCPQYLVLTDRDVQRMGAVAKMAPPPRTDEDREAMIRAIQTGVIDVIGSDHGAKMKKPDDPFFEAAFGGPEIETMLPITYDEGVNKGRFGVCKLVELFSENPAQIFGLYPKKGVIQEGSDADLILFDPNEIHIIQHKTQHSNAPYTLYEGRRCLGRPVFSMQRGKILIEGGEMKGKPGYGKFLPTKIKRDI